MPRPIQQTRISRLPVPEPICAGKLDSFDIETHGHRKDIVLEYQAFVPTAIELFAQEGKPYERSQGIYLPRRLRFLGIERLTISGLFQNMEVLPPDHPARIIVDMYNWQNKGERLVFYLLYGRSQEDADFQFFARSVKREERGGETVPFLHERDWSPAPPMPERLVPDPKMRPRRFGGDPVLVHLGSKPVQHRLFVGGLDVQWEQRPQVDAVLNLGEEPSRWVNNTPSLPSDRWANYGEGSHGMTVDVIRQEAEWVIERLRSGQRVLVHCVAGMNRSTTICCATLILLEGLTAEQALERVREQHPWARPDGHHWLALKWLAKTVH